jgi:phage shock protein A
MTETENLVLDHLRSIRSDTGELKKYVRDIKARLASIESYIATLHGDQARSSGTLDELTERVARLERRTGLVEGGA